MFTKEQLLAAHSKVKSGSDYPKLVQDLKMLGVLKYDHMVSNGSNVYYGSNNYPLVIKYDQAFIAINDESSSEKLKLALKIHQAGETNYPTFCLQAAEAGVEKWIADLNKMTVTYLDKSGRTLVSESIPSLDRLN